MISCGVPRVVSTLWRVSDVASALLISEVYTRLYHHAGSLSIAAALRGAQIWLRELTWDGAEEALGLRFRDDGSRLRSELRTMRGAAETPVCTGGYVIADSRELHPATELVC